MTRAGRLRASWPLLLFAALAICLGAGRVTGLVASGGDRSSIDAQLESGSPTRSSLAAMAPAPTVTPDIPACDAAQPFVPRLVYLGLLRPDAPAASPRRAARQTLVSRAPPHRTLRS